MKSYSTTQQSIHRLLIFTTNCLACCFTLVTSSSWGQTFSNTTVSACNTWDSGNTYPGLSKTIAVSGLPTPLGTGAGQVVLKQVNLQLGTTACKGNLSTYSARLVSPSGTIIQLFTTFTSTSTSQWINIKYRDDAALERIQDYATTVKQNYWPFSIGYYRTETAGAFAAVNGENPNGNWSLQVIENTTSEVSFERVDLVFGTAIQVTDISASTVNDACSGAQCVDNQSVVVGTNNGFSTPDPNYPGNSFGGCNWNGNNNNSAWFQFTASATTASLTVSGITNSSGATSSDTQLLIARRTGDCSTGSWLSVPSGGCPDDEAINNSSYLTTNGGVTTAGNVYVNGISANAEFNLTGLTVGATYYLYIDGNGGTASTFYIEAASGCQNCIVPLPIELLYFDAKPEDRVVQLNWATESERNNAYFVIERSTDLANWTFVDQIEGAGNSSLQLDYHTTDFSPLYGQSYYHLKQIDADGSETISEIRSVLMTTGFTLSPNPATDELQISGLPKSGNTQIKLLNTVGQVIRVFEANNSITSLNIASISNGVYFICIDGYEPIQFLKSTNK
jgi:Secretion system C-terminal sorting domain